MLYLYFLLLVAASQGLPMREVEYIPAPTLTHLATYDPPSFSIEWTQVKSLESSDPVVGYKVKVWKQPVITQYSYQIVDGEKKLVAEQVFGKLPMDKVPEGEPTEIIAMGATTTRALMNHIDLGITYQIRVLAFTEKAEGPLSQPFEVKLSPNENGNPKDLYTMVD